MSLILDALKKAEAERNAGTTQTVHTPPSFSTYQQRVPAWRRPWLWIALTASAAILGTGFWFATSRSPAPPPVAAAAPQERPAQESKAPTIAPPVQAVASRDATPDPVPKTEVAQPAKQKEKIARKPAEKKRAPAAVDEKTEKTAKAAQAAPAEPPLPTQRELPDQIQREIPALAIGGYIYSGNKADRSVLINKRLLREGDEVAPGLTLEKMMPNGMVMNYKGYRYRAGY